MALLGTSAAPCRKQTTPAEWSNPNKNDFKLYNTDGHKNNIPGEEAVQMDWSDGESASC